MVKILVPLFDGFEEIEALTVVDLLRRADVQVVTASITGSKRLVAGQKIIVESDTLLNEVLNDASFNGIVLPGGKGTASMGKCEPLLKLVQKYQQEGKLVAAICAAPTILGKAGVLTGKAATCYPSMVNELVCGTKKEDSVVIDGNNITSRGPGTAFDFGLTLVEKLQGKEKRNEIKAATVYPY